jgi:hypothetical protein
MRDDGVPFFVSRGAGMALEGLRKSIERGAVDLSSDAPRLPRIKWETVLGWLIAALLAYGAVDRRVAILETKYDIVQDQLRDIQKDVKELLKR